MDAARNGRRSLIGRKLNGCHPNLFLRISYTKRAAFPYRLGGKWASFMRVDTKELGDVLPYFLRSLWEKGGLQGGKGRRFVMPPLSLSQNEQSRNS